MSSLVPSSLSSQKLNFPSTVSALRKARNHFEKHHYLKLPKLIPRPALDFIKAQLASAAFVPRTHKNIASELCMKTNLLIRYLTFVLNDYELFKMIDTVTGCGSIGCFTGRIYRMKAGSHYDSWHDDWRHSRKIALSINLSDGPYKGGCLMLRYEKNPEKITLIPNTEFGSAVIFRLSGELEHQVSAVEGNTPKTAYAGWFRSKPDYLNRIKNIRPVKQRLKQ